MKTLNFKVSDKSAILFVIPQELILLRVKVIEMLSYLEVSDLLQTSIKMVLETTFNTTDLCTTLNKLRY